MEDQKVPANQAYFAVKKIHIQPELVTLEVLPLL
jgi:hypothetical protein